MFLKLLFFFITEPCDVGTACEIVSAWETGAPSEAVAPRSHACPGVAT